VNEDPCPVPAFSGRRGQGVRRMGENVSQDSLRSDFGSIAPGALSCFEARKGRLMTYVIVLLAVLTRFLPHTPNFSPVFGAVLFGERT
jgi:hypothetical protein